MSLLDFLFKTVVCFEGVEGENPTGIQLPVFGGVEVIVR